MKYLTFKINGKNVDINSLAEFPISLSYKLEDTDNFQSKLSSNALDIEIPATLNNDIIGNTFHNSGIADLTSGQAFRKPQPCVIEINNNEILTGKAFLKDASHNYKPISYLYDCYGDNADWLIDLKEATIYNFVKHITFYFTKVNIQASYLFDGTNENLPYVFAPMKYGVKMDKEDNNIMPEYMRPSLSLYFILYWGFKSLGYRIESTFFATSYFKRLILPWTWGNFLFSEGTKQDNLKFLAKSDNVYAVFSNNETYVNLGVLDSVPGAYDENNLYTHNTSTGEMRWTYSPAFNFGAIRTTFKIQIEFDATARATAGASGEIRWFKNGIEDITKRKPIFSVIHTTGFGRADAKGIFETNETFEVIAGDYIYTKVYISVTHADFMSSSNVSLRVLEFKYLYSQIILGGIIAFDTYNSFKNYKFLDLFAGVVDLFNLQFKTDPKIKVIYIEPTHDYKLPGLAGVQPGYFNNTWSDWNAKQDLRKISKISLVSDGEREQIFKFKADTNDGMLKTVQDRTQTTLAASKYVLPERYKAGKKEAINRFFSPVMHYDVNQWKYITGTAPQMIVLIPENISNTSREEAQNTFLPKLAYYKGVDNTVGWVSDGSPITGFPFAFAVNYRDGGENDPVLSYTDEQIPNGSGFVIGIGLMRRFYWQRLANMRNGEIYKTWMKLNSLDISNLLNRDFKIVKGQKWELLETNDYRPLVDDTTNVLLRKNVPIQEIDKDNSFPSQASILNGVLEITNFDIKYYPLKCLITDIPK